MVSAAHSPAPRATALHFIVHGPPVPKQRPREGRGGHFYTPTRTRSYEAQARTQAAIAVMGLRGTWRPQEDDRYSLTLHVYFAADRGDLDNVVKSIGDALNKAVWHDDRAVVEVHAWRHVDRAHPRVEVIVGVLP